MKLNLINAGKIGLSMTITNIISGIIIGLIGGLLGADATTPKLLLSGEPDRLIIVVISLLIISLILNSLILPFVLKIMKAKI